MGALKVLEKLRNMGVSGRSAGQEATFKFKGVMYSVLDVTVLEDSYSVSFEIVEKYSTDFDIDEEQICNWGQIRRALSGVDDGYSAYDDLGIIEEIEKQ